MNETPSCKPKFWPNSNLIYYFILYFFDKQGETTQHRQQHLDIEKHGQVQSKH